MTHEGARPARRIGLLTSSFPRSPEDVSGIFVLQFAAALAARGHEIDVLAPAPAAPVPPAMWLPPGIRLHHVAYLRPAAMQRTFYRAGAMENLATDPLAWPGALTFPLALRRAAIHCAKRWDALVSHWAVPAGLVAASLPHRGPHLAVMHSGDVHLLERLAGGDVLARFLAARASALLFTHEGLRAQFFTRIGPLAASRALPKGHVSPMGVVPPDAPPGGRSAARRRLGLSSKEPRLAITMSRLVPIKGIDVAIQAVAHLGGRVRLAVAGEGPERNALQRLARSLNAPVRFLGPLHGAAKRDWVAAADVLLLPSRSLPDGRCEGVPHAALEALAAGLPVLASRSGGLPTLASTTAVRLVPSEDPHALAQALSEWPDPHRRSTLARAARRAVAPLHWHRLAPRIEALLFDAPHRLQPSTTSGAAV